MLQKDTRGADQKRLASVASRKLARTEQIPKPENIEKTSRVIHWQCLLPG